MEWGETRPAIKFFKCFFQVELAIILNGFLNIRLTFARRECNADRCPSRKCDTFAFCVNGLVSVLT